MEMKKALKTSVASATALAAGGAVAEAQDWTGPYAGLSFGTNWGTSPYQPYVYDEGYQIGGESFGGHVGTRWNINPNMLMGVELAINGPINADALNDGDNDPEDYMLNGLTDLKLSLGMPVGDALVYGFGGMSFGKGIGYSNDYEYMVSGANVGLGVEYMVTDKISLGAEYIQRHMNGYTSGGNPENPSPMQSLSLRASFHF
ncbi:porin family protein [Loktanella sp. IMCC34160]|uniref:outer membrane beta-barrel protein n=1 Tax=Loktanella sp. IMCC34160 TaxID=2510646 RepID=UPI00101BB790|nr:outer membrane beta-barrel protein [Loktanella sp. IMCC34160]RYG93101.1 porin family protein [Loktanella sp. IMCC34160]